MRTLTTWSIVTLTVALAGPATAADYYVSPNGSNGNPGTEQQPWGQLQYGVNQLDPGDSLHVADGNYGPVKFGADDSGESGSPVRIVAENDGQVTVDGSSQLHALTINGDHIVVEGMVFEHSDDSSVVTINGDHNTLRRVSGYYAGANGYNATFKIRGSHNLIVDSVGAGAHSHVFTVYSADYDEMHNVFRRTFAYGGDVEGDAHGAARSEFNIYGGSNNIVENCIGWGGAKNKSLSIHSRWDKPEMAARNNEVYGSIFKASQRNGITLGYGYAATGTLVDNVVVYGHDQVGIRVWGGYEESDETFRNVTVVDNGHQGDRPIEQYGIGLVERGGDEVTPGVTLENALIADNRRGMGGIAEPTSVTYTNSWGNGGQNFTSTRGPNCISTDPELPEGEVPVVVPSDSPCKGAGRDGADMGANVRYRYVDGQQTDKPLWPWPMQDRIEDELGIDVTGTLAPEAADPHVVATGSPTSGRAPLSVDFEADTRGVDGSATFEWTFGDGSNAESGANVSHTYANGGEYTASVTATLDDGKTLEDSVTVEVADRLELSARPVDSAPTIDGEFSESGWEDASPIAFRDPEGTSDNRVEARAVRSDRGVTLAFEVDDDQLRREPDADPWTNDGIEFAVDVGDDGGDSLKSDDLKWIVEMDGSVQTASGKGDGGTWTPHEPSESPEASARQDENSYTIEIRLPWALVGGEPMPSDRLPLLIANNDRDDDRTRQYLWASTIDFLTPSSWGALAFAPADPSDADTADVAEPTPGGPDTGDAPDTGSSPLADAGDDDSTPADGGADRGCSTAPGGGSPATGWWMLVVLSLAGLLRPRRFWTPTR